MIIETVNENRKNAITIIIIIKFANVEMHMTQDTSALVPNCPDILAPVS